MRNIPKDYSNTRQKPKIYQYSRTFCISIYQITNAYMGTGPVNQDTVK
jgi:hypothetical protein